MNISMTWAGYVLMVSVCLVVYYSIVLIFIKKKFNPSPSKTSGIKNDCSQTFSEESVVDTVNNQNLFGEPVQAEEPSSVEEDFSPDAQDFADEIAAYTSACGDNTQKEVLLQDVKNIIQKYPSLVESDAHYELSQLIAISTENYCSIHLSADELRELWKG